VRASTGRTAFRRERSASRRLPACAGCLVKYRLRAGQWALIATCRYHWIGSARAALLLTSESSGTGTRPGMGPVSPSRIMKWRKSPGGGGGGAEHGRRLGDALGEWAMSESLPPICVNGRARLQVGGGCVRGCVRACVRASACVSRCDHGVRCDFRVQ
jgi:hypothetical protein